MLRILMQTAAALAALTPWAWEVSPSSAWAAAVTPPLGAAEVEAAGAAKGKLTAMPLRLWETQAWQDQLWKATRGKKPGAGNQPADPLGQVLHNSVPNDDAAAAPEDPYHADVEKLLGPCLSGPSAVAGQAVYLQAEYPGSSGRRVARPSLPDGLAQRATTTELLSDRDEAVAVVDAWLVWKTVFIALPAIVGLLIVAGHRSWRILRRHRRHPPAEPRESEILPEPPLTIPDFLTSIVEREKKRAASFMSPQRLVLPNKEERRAA